MARDQLSKFGAGGGINPQVKGNPVMHNKVLVNIVAADALVLKHQSISSHNVDLVLQSIVMKMIAFIIKT